MRVLRRSAKLKLKFFFAALVLTGVLWFSYGRSEPETWRTLATGKLVKIQVENAIYEKPGSPDYLLRVKITNFSPRFVGLERYENARLERNAQTGIEKSWQSTPLWWKAKRFLPDDNFRSPYFIASIKGQITASDGQSAQWFSLGFHKNYLAFKYPIRTKTLP